MNIPLNGRIAIIDDKIDQAMPLINVLAKRRCPYLYFSGEVKYLPDEGDRPNDIRILFLDINLIDDQEHPPKVLKGRLVPVLKRVISKDNYPYVLVFWSRNEAEHGTMIEEIFNTDLKDRKPIAFVREESKLSYYSADGEPTENYEENVAGLFDNISSNITNFMAYSNMLNWENKVHSSADKTLQEIFKSCHTYESWSDNAGFLISKLGESYSGKNTFKAQNDGMKLKSSYQAFNNVFYDTLEYSINNSSFENLKTLTYNPDLADKETIYSVNRKLLISEEKSTADYSGTVVHDTDPQTDDVFKELQNNCFDRKMIAEEIGAASAEEDRTEDNNTKLKKLIEKECSKKRTEIRKSWKKIYFVTTPLCDFVQRKCYNSRVIKGMLIKAEYLDYIDQRSEAIFVSPKFKFDKDTYVLILHFRYFFTAPVNTEDERRQPLFRVRQQLLSEVQSKLARHISRQGILFIDDN
jgi:hypothetical protein